MKTCILENCERKHYAFGYCNLHWRRFKKHGDPNTVKNGSTTHGMKHTRIYSIWMNMRNRCSNPKAESYKTYGGRGIKVCERWQNSFEHFYADMGAPPSDKHQIDRQDNDKDYEPGNCRWLTRRDNMRNSPTTKLTPEIVREIRASKETLQVLADRYGMNKNYMWFVKSGRKWADVS